MKSIPFNDLSRQHQPLLPEIRASLDRVLGHSEFILGRETTAFEKAWSEFTGAKHAIACTSGTDALVLALLASGIGHGHEVITTSLTFIATLEAIVTVGATPVLADIDPVTGQLDPAEAEKKITPKTRAIMPVHVYGMPPDMKRFAAICQKHRLILIEDAAQAHGTTLDGQHAGTFGHFGGFSFYPGKNLGAMGDAGAVITQDDDLAKKLRLYRDHGRTSRYEHCLMGRNMRIDAFQSAILAVKLPHLRAWTDTREKIATRLRQGLSDTPGVSLIPVPKGARVSNHLFVLRHRRRDEFAARLEAKGVEARVHYGIPNHKQVAWTSQYPAVSLPVVEKFASETFSIPCFETMTDDEIARVISITQDVARELST